MGTRTQHKRRMGLARLLLIGWLIGLASSATAQTQDIWQQPVIAGVALTAGEQSAIDQSLRVGVPAARALLAQARADMARDLMARGLADADPLLQKAALRYAASAADLDPHNPQRWVLLGALYEAIAPLDPFAVTEAEVAYLQALSIAPAHPQALLGLAGRRLQTGRYAEALDPLETLLETSAGARTQPVLLAQAGLAYVHSRELARGIAFFNTLLPRLADPAQGKLILAVLYGERHEEGSERALLEELAASGTGPVPDIAHAILEGRR